MEGYSERKFYDNSVPVVKDQSDAIPIFIADVESDLPSSLSIEHRRYADKVGFFKEEINSAILSDESGNISAVLMNNLTKTRFLLGSKIACLPSGIYAIRSNLSNEDALEAVLGFGLSSYKYDRYREKKFEAKVKLCVPKNISIKQVHAFCRSEYFVRNLINTPASDLGPVELEKIVSAFARDNTAQFKSIVGDELLKENFPMIHAVGRAGLEPPRLVEFSWGQGNSYKLTLVGKGVCFDTGGLNIKPGGSMATMKKDMGGAASVLGLANCIISLGLDVSLRVIIPIVENSISSNSFRPSDILMSRKGLTVEVNNTDAEGRLILADALSYADEKSPDLLICMATLTGAARIALGPDIAPFYTENNNFAELLYQNSCSTFDPVWRLPFHSAYEHLIEPEIADLDNAPQTGMAGSITAALFLKKFVGKSEIFVHFDIFAWSASSKPGRPTGGLMQAVRALYITLENKLNF